jgi:NAD(P)-dependent dehydrogenase (short-subunit alcohol dehydrogenase family)
MPPITGSNILVIGGSSGIGAAVAKLAAAEQDVTVSIASSNPARVEKTVQQIQKAVPTAQIKGYTVDVGGDNAEAQIENLLKEVMAATERPLDHIVYTAVRLQFKFLHDVTVDFLRGDSQFLVIVPLLIAKIAPAYMVKSYRSSITFTSGRIAEKPMKGAAALAAWGTALLGITRTLALDLAPIRVNVVSPGTTDTEIQGSGEERVKKMAAVAETALLGKVGAPEEVAEAYIYLIKDSNNTGTCVSTSGGELLQ